MPTDILIDIVTNDLASEDGDFAIGDSTRQHQVDLLVANEGEYKQFPVTGVGIEGFLLDEDKTDMIRKIRSQFTRDGMSVLKVTAIGGININAQYK
ncbi:MAG: hypothetical protein NTU51_05890 [Bacteroidetes bacterium]|nr:hypothetical protein [Bacteroidota bacterium]